MFINDKKNVYIYNQSLKITATLLSVEAKIFVMTGA